MKQNLLISAAIRYLDKDKFLRENTHNDPNIGSLLSHIDPQVRKTAFTEYGSDEGITSDHILQGLNDADWRVRYAAINHEGVTPEHIDVAINDEDPAIRETAAGHYLATGKHLEQASKDPVSSVREIVARNPNTSKELLSNMFMDNDSRVRHAAVDSLYSR